MMNAMNVMLDIIGMNLLKPVFKVLEDSFDG
jgi:hypothetical protein